MRLKGITRRDFLKSSALLGAAAVTRISFAQTTTDQNKIRLLTGWEYHHGSLGGPWEIWKGESTGDHATWQVVSLPHCFNARDAVDPDQHYYQGPGWYRTRLKINNPF
ncbi:MAG TPA: twin-arginine translocation signal domain-containing protein, partial [Terriglobales bacterium]